MADSYNGVLCNCIKNKDNHYELMRSDFQDTLLSTRNKVKNIICSMLVH